MYIIMNFEPTTQSDFIPRKSRRSEYLGEMKTDGSGFMTQREKEWVIRIQLLQLQATDPANEDFYYLVYIQACFFPRRVQVVTSINHSVSQTQERVLQ